MSAEQPWLDAMWPAVRSHMPPPPATVVELGCGRLGGFVPRLREDGYGATGIDPVAPEGETYRRVEFERSDLPTQLDAVVACTSLHHVAEPREVLDKIAGALTTGGLVIVIEWDWESFDEATAHWCFERLGSQETEGWLHHGRAEWAASGRSWEEYLKGWAREHGVHSAREVLAELDERFQRVFCRRGPYFFPDLAGTTEAQELEAINAGRIQATRIEYVGRLSS